MTVIYFRCLLCLLYLSSRRWQRSVYSFVYATSAVYLVLLPPPSLIQNKTTPHPPPPPLPSHYPFTSLVSHLQGQTFFPIFLQLDICLQRVRAICKGEFETQPSPLHQPATFYIILHVSSLHYCLFTYFGQLFLSFSFHNSC